MRSKKRRELPHAPRLIARRVVFEEEGNTVIAPLVRCASRKKITALFLAFVICYLRCTKIIVFSFIRLFFGASLNTALSFCLSVFLGVFPLLLSSVPEGFFLVIPDSSRGKAGASLKATKPCAGLFLWSRADRARVSRSMINNSFFNPKQFFNFKISDWISLFVKKG